MNNKVRVTKIIGGGAALGVMEPRVNMITHQGKIIALDSGNLTVHVGLGTGNVHGIFHPHELFVDESHASGVWSWPSGDGSIVFGRNNLWPTGVPKALGSGMVYLNGAGVPQTFSR